MTGQPETLRVMPREMRLMTKRCLSLSGLPRGFKLMVSDVVMYSEAMGLGGFELFEKRLAGFAHADPAAMALVSDSPDEMVLDAAAQHGWFVVSSALDLLEEVLGDEQARICGRDLASIRIDNVFDPEELEIAVGMGARAGLKIKRNGTTLTARRADAASDPVLERILNDGCPIRADLWWRIYELAQSSLTPESAVSRRHAGPVIVADDGRIIGRKDNDDDTDFDYLSSPGAFAASDQ